jgi:hypothetical protein
MSNKLACVLGGVVAVVAIASSQATLAQTSADSRRDGSRDMDFSFGRWRTDITSFKAPFDHPGETTHMSGIKTVSPIWGGKALLEEIEADGPGGHWEAANLFLYDPNAHQWSQNYVDSETGRFEGPPAIGGHRGGDLEFYWQATIKGRATLERGIWTDFTPISHTYRVQRSNDGGRTWHTSFEARLTKIQ